MSSQICLSVGKRSASAGRNAAPSMTSGAPMTTSGAPREGHSIAWAIECPSRGAPLVVIGAPLVIDGAAFRPADADLFPTLKQICDDIHRSTWQKTPPRRTPTPREDTAESRNQ